MKPIVTPFGFSSTALEVMAGIDLSGKKAIITGASSGIGIETARALAVTGVEVILAVRNLEAGEAVVRELIASTGNRNVRAVPLDLNDHASIQSFAANWQGPLDILVNNAGIMALQELQLTPEGWEMQFATNHMGHFELSLALHGALAAAGNARIVSLSSSAHFRSPVIFDDLHFRYRYYDPTLAYAQSKTANVLFAVEASKRWAADGITANAVMPGAIPTNLQRHVGARLNTPGDLQKTPQQGAATSVLLATSPLLEGIGGRYFMNCTQAEVVVQRTADLTGVAPFALDPENAERLWEMSLKMLG